MVPGRPGCWRGGPNLGVSPSALPAVPRGAAARLGGRAFSMRLKVRPRPCSTASPQAARGFCTAPGPGWPVVSTPGPGWPLFSHSRPGLWPSFSTPRPRPRVRYCSTSPSGFAPRPRVGTGFSAEGSAVLPRPEPVSPPPGRAESREIAQFFRQASGGRRIFSTRGRNVPPPRGPCFPRRFHE